MKTNTTMRISTIILLYTIGFSLTLKYSDKLIRAFCELILLFANR